MDEKPMQARSLAIAWSTDVAEAAELGAFFAAHITPEYISHSELQGPRALDVGRWRPGIAGIFSDEIADRVGREKGEIGKNTASYPVLSARQDGRLVGMALVSFFLAAPIPYAMLEDIVVEQTLRGQGIGKAIIDWVTRQAEAAGCQRIFLESGLGNHKAHDLFHREGFTETSVVMMKRIKPAG
jgi:GNAT superfamily N-acetyltransferase